MENVTESCIVGDRRFVQYSNCHCPTTESKIEPKSTDPSSEIIGLNSEISKIFTFQISKCIDVGDFSTLIVFF